jgi:hypothetical protein
MSADKRSPHTDALAVEPVIAKTKLQPGMHVGLHEGFASADAQPYLGIVDPFLERAVQPGERFWLVVYPRQITSLRHVWTHPAFAAGDAAAGLTVAEADSRAVSEKWMREWAVKHMRYERYEDDPASEDEIEAAYEFAIEAGHHLSVGAQEDARDHINDEWWDHWEAITGQKGQRGEYFSCAC